MNSKNKVILYAIIIGIILYLTDSVIYYFAFAEERTFMQVFITAVPFSEIYNRLLMVVGVIIFGFIVSGLISDLSLENEFLKHQPSAGDQGSKLDMSFTSSLSYQIRTPLNAIVGFSDLLKDPNLSAQSKQTYINHIHSSGNYLLQLINNIVDISKIEANKLEINNSECDVNELFDNISKYWEEKKKEIGKKDIEFRIEKSVKDTKFKIITDKERLNQALSNLLENGFKNTEEGYVEMGYILKENNLLEFYIKDTGKGISMDRIEIIFNRYKKLSDNHNQPFDGKALRMTISKSLVKLLGGKIWAKSKPGQGSTFYFTLPFESIIASEPIEIKVEEKTSPIIEKKTQTTDWSKHTILIAEDVESNYIYLRELLRPTNAELIWAENGEEAVKKVKSNPKIDLILMDILMPEMDGYEASKNIKELRPKLPIIAQTAYSIEGGQDKAVLENFDNYLIKPIWSPQLMTALSKYL